MKDFVEKTKATRIINSKATLLVFAVSTIIFIIFDIYAITKTMF